MAPSRVVISGISAQWQKWLGKDQVVLDEIVDENGK